MTEKLDYYSVEGEHLGQMDKKKLHEKMRQEYQKKGKVSVRHTHTRLILLNSKGRIILQRRSKWKGDNAGMWDKTIGGHVTKGDSFDLTMLKECAEELGIPATIVDKSEFENSVTTTDLHVLGILKKLSYLDCDSHRKQKDGKIWVEPSMVQFYIGYYDGAVRFIDKESCGIQVFSLDELKEELKDSPDDFTEDVRYIIDKFESHIKPIETKGPHELSD